MNAGSRASTPLVFAHRGASSRAPENTIAAFQLLLEMGVTAVELDIHQCATGELVVAHDYTLERTAGVNVRITDTPLVELRKHDVGAWFDERYADERIPLLAEVFALMGDAVTYDIEIKPHGMDGFSAKPGGVEATLADLIRNSGLSDRCIVSSFDPFAVRRFAGAAPDVPTALIYTNSRKAPVIIRHARGLAFCSPNVMKPEHTAVTSRYVERHHRKGRRVFPWTVDDPAEARRLVEAGVDGIITNVPDLIRKELG